MKHKRICIKLSEDQRILARHIVNYYTHLCYLDLSENVEEEFYKCNTKYYFNQKHDHKIFRDSVRLVISSHKTLLKLDLDSNLCRTDILNVLLSIDVLNDYLDDKLIDREKLNIEGIELLYDRINKILDEK